jgi:hypothetical protein
MKKSIALLFLFFIFDYSMAQEVIYPEGHNIVVTYGLSSFDLEIGDTLLASRTVTNNESFDLTNLYLAENLPFEFEILWYSLEIDGIPIPHYYSGPVRGDVFPSCDSYRWVIDDPAPGDTANRVLMPGESLALEYAIGCTTVGNYALPFHTLCAYGDTSGIFTVADSLAVTSSPGSQAGEEPFILPSDSYVGPAYPNPFNSEVVIDLSRLEVSGAGVRLKIYDLLGNEVFCGEYNLTAERCRIHWRPEKNIAAGVYFYRLETGAVVSAGKMTFLK